MEERAESPAAKRPKFMRIDSEGKILPEELLLHIFSYLRKTHLVQKAGRVCKYWADLSLDSSLWHEVSLRGVYPMSRDLGARLVGRMRQLKKLKAVTFFNDDIDDVLDVVCSNIEVLHLEDMHLKEENLSRLASRCQKLKKVYIKQCNMKGQNRHLLDIFSASENLQSISLIETRGSRPLDMSVVRNWQGLKELSTITNLPSADAEVKVLTASVGAQIVKFTAWKLMVPRSYTLIGQFANLEELHLIKNYCMTDSCLVNGLSKLKNLRALTLRDATYISPGAMNAFLRLSDTFKTLTKLDVGNNPSVENTCLSAISTTCPHLIQLNVDGCANITLDGVITLVKNCKDLMVLDVRICSLGTKREGRRRLKAVKPSLKIIWNGPKILCLY